MHYVQNISLVYIVDISSNFITASIIICLIISLSIMKLFDMLITVLKRFPCFYV